MLKRRVSFLLFSSVALAGLSPALAQDNISGTGFVISLGTSEAPKESVAAQVAKAETAPLVGKAELPTAEVLRTPAVAPAPLTSVAGVSERLNAPEDLAEPATSWLPERQPGEWFGTGMADLTVGGFGGDRFDRGRIAGYVEGTTRSGINVVASADTREVPLRSLFSDFGSRDPDRVLDRMRNEQNYVTYGDDSTSREAAPTSGKAYVLLEKEGNSFLWGDFRVTNDARRYARTDRTLYGLRLTHESGGSDQESPRVRADIWAASPDRVSRRDILRATGGAVYSLSRADAFPGTEKVMVRVVDTFTGRIVSSETLNPGVDYRFNAFQGVLILNSPIANVVDDGTLRREVVVAYEHTPKAGDPDGQVLGGRVTHKITPNLTLGLSANQETSGADEHRIYGVDGVYESEAFSLSAEVARSKGPQIGVTTTDLGGFGNQETLSYGDANSSGTAVRLGARADLNAMFGINGNINFRHEQISEGFASPDDYIDADQRDTGVTATFMTGRGTMTAEVDDFRSDDGRKERDYSLGYAWDPVSGQTVSLRAEQTVRRDPDDAENTGKRNVIGARWDVARTDTSGFWLFGHGTVSRTGGLPTDNRLGLGFSTTFKNGWNLSAEGSGGSLGPAGYAEVSRTQGQQEVSFGYKREALDPSMDDDREGEGYAYLRVTQTLSETLSVKAEGRDYVAGTELGHASAIGGTWTDMGWKVDTTMTFGTLRSREESDIDRQGLSFGAAFVGDGKHSGAVRLEYRRDKSEDEGRDGRVIAATGTYQYAVNESWRGLASLEFIEAKGGESFDAGRYMKADIGAAWRGAESDRWAAIFLLSRVEDVPGNGVLRDDGEGDKQKATVISVDVNHKPAPRWTLGAKGAYRWLDSAPAGSDDFVRSRSGLGVLRADYEIDQKWDVSADVRFQSFVESGATRTGATIGVWREVGPNARLGVGYHTGGVHDDLRDLDAPEKGLFLNMTAKF